MRMGIRFTRKIRSLPCLLCLFLLLSLCVTSTSGKKRGSKGGAKPAAPQAAANQQPNPQRRRRAPPLQLPPPERSGNVDQQFIDDLKLRISNREGRWATANLTTGFTNLGDPRRMQNFLSKLARMEPVHIAAVGGSITTGNGIDKRAKSYGDNILSWLQHNYRPKQGFHHEYMKIGKPGHGSYYFDQCLPSNTRYKSVEAADLIIVELTANDLPLMYVEGIVDKTFNPGTSNIEGLVRKFLQLPKVPAVVFLSFGILQDDLTWLSAQSLHQPVLKRYKIPGVSFLNFAQAEYQVTDRKIRAKILADHVHPTVNGHILAAELVLDLIWMSALSAPELSTWTGRQIPDPVVETLKQLPQPLAGGWDNADDKPLCVYLVQGCERETTELKPLDHAPGGASKDVFMIQENKGFSFATGSNLNYFLTRKVPVGLATDKPNSKLVLAFRTSKKHTMISVLAMASWQCWGKTCPGSASIYLDNEEAVNINSKLEVKFTTPVPVVLGVAEKAGVHTVTVEAHSGLVHVTMVLARAIPMEYKNQNVWVSQPRELAEKDEMSKFMADMEDARRDSIGGIVGAPIEKFKPRAPCGPTDTNAECTKTARRWKL